MESPFAAASLLELLVFIVWDCLQGTPAASQNPLFARFFQSLADIMETANQASLCFAPGLFDVLKNATPPAVAFFRSLPPAPDLSWGVYIILLKKLDCRPRLYVGSATMTGHSKTCGLRARFAQYDRGVSLPTGVKAALDEGFTITRKAPICYAAQPSPALQSICRVIFYAIEAAFAYIFWAMKACPDDHDLARICIWDVSTLEWDGICSHCALQDGIQGHFHETAEQVEAHVKAMEERRRARKSDWYYMQMATNYADFRERMLENSRRWLAENPGRDRENQAKRIGKIRAEGRHHCEDCNLSCSSVTQLERHLRSDQHLLKAGEQRDPESQAKWEAERLRTQDSTIKRRANNIADERYICDLCDHAYSDATALKDHLLSDQHLLKAGEQRDPEIAAEWEARRQRNRDLKAEVRTRNIAEKNFHCVECDVSCSSAEGLEYHLLSDEHLRKTGEQLDPEREAKREARRQYGRDAIAKRRATAIAEKKFHCVECDLACSSAEGLAYHLLSDAHLLKAGEQLDPAREAERDARRQRARDIQAKYRTRNIAKKKFHCVECDLSYPCARDLERHLRSAQHKAKVQLLKAGLATPAAHNTAETPRATKDEVVLDTAEALRATKNEVPSSSTTAKTISSAVSSITSSVNLKTISPATSSVSSSASSSVTSSPKDAFDILKAGAAKQASKVIKRRSKKARAKSVQAGQPLISAWLGKQRKD